MNSNLRRFAIFLGALVLIGGGFAAYGFLGKDSVPNDFREGREKAAFISERIVENSATLAKNLERVNQLEKEKKLVEASALTEELTKKNEEIRKDALELASELAKMTRSISDIRNGEARSAALEAINHELSVATHLLSYSDFVGKLFETLQDRFRRNRDIQARSWIEEINKEVSQINEFNSKAKQAFERFDSLVK